MPDVDVEATSLAPASPSPHHWAATMPWGGLGLLPPLDLDQPFRDRAHPQNWKKKVPEFCPRANDRTVVESVPDGRIEWAPEATCFSGP